MLRVRVRSALRLAVAALLCLLSAAAFSQTVSVREENIVIPTYEAGPPEPNPLFFFGRSSQGAQAPVYPYAMYDVLTGKKADRGYKIVYLENEYIRIGVMPELGGRIFEGLDKTNNYHFFYRQHVIKPALIGLLGAWISGGVEWNIPHHHRATTFVPVQYSVEENADGSKTVWVGELELRHRMRWAVGYTLRPGRAYIETSLRVVNRTPVANTMLCFANVAVHASQEYQVIFPPGTQFSTGHSKRSFQHWPVPEAGPGAGSDMSWYKNHIPSASVFAWNYDEDFVAGYDHGKQAGTMSVADHHVVPGKKFFTWGNGTIGRTWDGILTDDDGPYLELMVGAYSDNQPDYSWMQPYETREFSMTWYPFRDIGGVKRANLQAAVNLDVSGGNAKVGFYATSARQGAIVTLKAGNRVLLRETVSIDPGKPYTKQVPVPAGIDEHELAASLSDDGKELVSYSPVRLEPEPLPVGTIRPAAPEEIKTNEELYLIGLRAQQFHDPAVDPMPYWEEALRRDPGDTRVNTVLGVTAYRKARYEEAEAYLRKAIARLTDQYTAPKDAEALYYLGAVLKAADRSEEAYSHFYKATWSMAWKAASYYSLAEIATGRGDWAMALDFVNRAISSDALNIRAQNLKAAILRHAGNPAEAMQVLSSASHRADPLDVRAMAERWLASKTAPAAKQLSTTLSEHPATAQEVAAEYLNAGLWRDGLEVLAHAVATAPERSGIHPMVYYYMGLFAGRLEQPEKAAGYYRLAKAAPSEYVFPFQHEAIPVLRAAMNADARDARAPYYLGNLLYDWQPEEAEKLWEISAALDPSFPIVHRNLAVAYMHRKAGSDIGKAITAMEKAVSLQSKYALHFTELDDLYAQTGATLEKRLAVFEANAGVVAQRDDAQNRAIGLKLAAGKTEDAIRMMTGRTFAVAEGANLNVGEQWTDAHLLLARRDIGERRYAEALASLEKSANLPPNLPSVGRGNNVLAERHAELAYWTGVAYEGMGQPDKAAESWNSGIAPPSSGARRGAAGGGPPVTWGSSAVGANAATAAGMGAQPYYAALCYLKLGRADEARPLFRGLVDSGQQMLEQLRQGDSSLAPRRGSGYRSSRRVRLADAHYMTGLGHAGLNDGARAREQFLQALESSPDHLGARTALNALR